jgi:lysophospholipase L1-like esterase
MDPGENRKEQNRMDRRQFISLTAATVGAAAVAPALAEGPALTPKVEADVAWYNVQEWGVEGKGWQDTAGYFDRLPARAEGTVRAPVWSLSRHSAGMLARFETDSGSMHARYSLLSPNLAMPHMPATGVSGLDLYARDERGRDRWLAVARPTAQKMEVRLVERVDPAPGSGMRRYTLYLPLYNGVEALEIGIDAKARFKPAPPRREKPVLFYGTSIMHGACASRPGMAIPAILGRRLGQPVINLGFSGNGQMEPEVGALLAELDPSAYVIDCLPNMAGPLVAERTEPLVRQLRAAHPETPILLVEDRTYTYAPFLKSARERHAGSRGALRKAYENLKAAGVKELRYLEGDLLLGEDGEGATDGSHPNDLGMMRYADAYEKALLPILSRGAG